jgi:hypothetical protein
VYKKLEIALLLATKISALIKDAEKYAVFTGKNIYEAEATR